MQVDYLGSIFWFDCLHFSIQGTMNLKLYPPLPDKVQYDFSGMGPWLFGGLIALCKRLLYLVTLPFTNCSITIGMTGIVGLFIPFSHTVDLLYAIGGTILFSGYIVYDTYLINNRLSPDEYIMAAISLYLECVHIIVTSLPDRLTRALFHVV